MRAYGRRHRRWSRRTGQPILVVPDEPLLILAIAGIGRALFRYRSELAPLTLAIGLGLTALLLHQTEPGGWPWIALLTAGTALAAGLRGFPWGLDRLEERVYVMEASGSRRTDPAAIDHQRRGRRQHFSSSPSRPHCTSVIARFTTARASCSVGLRRSLGLPCRSGLGHISRIIASTVCTPPIPVLARPKVNCSGWAFRWPATLPRLALSLVGQTVAM